MWPFNTGDCVGRFDCTPRFLITCTGTTKNLKIERTYKFHIETCIKLYTLYSNENHIRHWGILVLFFPNISAATTIARISLVSGISWLWLFYPINLVVMIQLKNSRKWQQTHITLTFTILPVMTHNCLSLFITCNENDKSSSVSSKPLVGTGISFDRKTLLDFWRKIFKKKEIYFYVIFQS